MVCLDVVVVVVDCELRAVGVIVVDDAELSVDVVESVLPDRVVGGFFATDAAPVLVVVFIDC